MTKNCALYRYFALHTPGLGFVRKVDFCVFPNGFEQVRLSVLVEMIHRLPITVCEENILVIEILQ
jgi:hypothetical protein